MNCTKTSMWLVFVILLGAAPRSAAQSASVDARWADLANASEAKSTRALLALAATPKETVAFLKDHLRPVKTDAKRVAQLVKQLDSNNFTARNQAMVELEYYGKYIRTDLEAALKDNPAVETKMRIQQLIEKMPVMKKEEPAPTAPPKVRPGSSISVSNVNGMITILIDGKPIDFSKMAPPPPPPGPPQHWLRAAKAILILEHIGTPEARQLIETMSAGEADALPTIAAREALERMKKD